MKKPQWTIIAAAIILVAAIYSFGRTVPRNKAIAATDNQPHTDDDGHDHSMAISTDTILYLAKKQVVPTQLASLNQLETELKENPAKQAKLETLHRLSHFWSDTVKMFEPYAWYEAEAARLENSEKSLTFAAHLFLENLQQDRDPGLAKWKALQAKDLFERSLKINPANDSSKAGLGACYLFGNISETPMEGIAKIREVVERDSSHVFAQMLLAKGSLVSGQYAKAIERLKTINRLQPANLEAMLMLADVYERTGEKTEAVNWYRQSLKHINRVDARVEIEKRISELKK